MKLVSLICFCFLFASFAFAQKETGTIEGTILDSDAHPIPGVTVTASSSSLIGGSRTTHTNTTGFYSFPVLAPGVYELKAELNGFQPVVRKDISLSIITTLKVNFSLQLLQLAEAIEVSEVRPPLIDSATTAVTSTVPAEIVSNLPRSQDIRYLIGLTPGVSDDGVAFGAESNQWADENSYWVDGVNMSNPASVEFRGGLILQYDQNWIDQVQVLGIGAPAEFGGFTGVTANFVTKSGGNDFHGMFETFFQNEDMVSRNTQKSVWGISQEVPFKTYDISTQLGGPILRDKLWFFSGYQYPHTETPDDNPTDPSLSTASAAKMLNKLTYKWNDNNTLQGFVQFNNAVNSWDNYNHPEISTVNKAPQLSWNATWLSILGPNTTLEARIGGFTDDSKDIEDRPDLPSHFDCRTGTRSVNNGGWNESTARRFQSNISLSQHAENFLRGAHDFRFGVQFNRTHNDFEVHYNGSMSYNDNCMYGYDYGGPLYTFRNISPDFGFPTNTNTFAAYAQDEWNITKALTLSLGARWDHNRGGTNIGTFHRNDQVAPRFGFVWSIDEEHETVIKAHYGHYFEALFPNGFLQNPSELPTITQIYRNEQWEEIYREYRFPISHIPHDLQQPFMRQFDVGVDRVLPGTIPFGVHYIYRHWEHLIAGLSLNDDSDFYQVTITNPFTEEPFIIDLLKPGIEDKGEILTNPPWMFRRYHGLEVYASKQLGNRLTFMTSLVYSDLRGNDVSRRRDPNFSQFNLHVDRPLSFKISGTAFLPWGFNAAWYFRHESGDTWARYIRGFYVPVCGCYRDVGEPAGSNHLPSKNIVDLRFEKEFPIYSGQLRTTIDVFNLFNSSAPLGIENDILDPNFGKSGRFVSPRAIRAGLRYTF